MYVGLDLHKLYSQCAVVDQDGTIVREERIESDPKRLEEFSESLESGTSA